MPIRWAKGTKCMVVVDGKGVPLGNYLDSAFPAEVSDVEKTISTIAVLRGGPGHPRMNPERLIADKAYDSNPLREQLARKGIELTAPRRNPRVKPLTQDGRPLRHYKRRWIVERTIFWLGYCRRLLVRWERHIEMYRAFVHVALLLLVLRRL